MEEVLVHNETDAPIWVIIAENSKHLVETKTKTVGEVEFELYYKMMIEGKASLPIEGVPIDASGTRSTEWKTRLKVYWESHQEQTFEWSGFIVAGELEIAAKSQNKWALKADELPYYISVRTMGGRTVASAVARRDHRITIDASGHIADPIPHVPIASGATVYLQRAGTTSLVGDPITGKSNWDAGTCGATGGAHRVDVPSGTLQSGSLVRLASLSSTLVDRAFCYMYSSDIGNVYYDKKRKDSSRAGKKQSWKLSKTSNAANSTGTTLHFGDEVVVSNANWPRANLGINGSWLQCVNDDATVWVLRDDPRL